MSFPLFVLLALGLRLNNNNKISQFLLLFMRSGIFMVEKPSIFSHAPVIIKPQAEGGGEGTQDMYESL